MVLGDLDSKRIFVLSRSLFDGLGASHVAVRSFLSAVIEMLQLVHGAARLLLDFRNVGNGLLWNSLLHESWLRVDETSPSVSLVLRRALSYILRQGVFLD